MKTITEILKKSNSELAKLMAKASASQNLAPIFYATLDANLTKHCHFANYKNSELTVTVPNTSWATKLRYAIPDIIKNLQIQPEFKSIAAIRYTITQQLTTAKPKKSCIKPSHHNEILWQKTIADLKKKTKQN